MFNNIGRTIKYIAIALFVIGVIGFGTYGLYLISCGKYNGADPIVSTRIIIMILGKITSYIASCLMYGFGELIEATVSINNKLQINNINNMKEDK